MPLDAPGSASFAAAVSDLGHLLARSGLRPDGIADLSAFGLSAEAQEERRSWIGGSDAKIICDGDPVAVNHLARQKLGAVAPANLSNEVQVMAGQFMEPFILAWAEKELGLPLSRRGERVIHKRHKFLAATLDGWCEGYPGGGRPVQTKYFSAFMTDEQACEIAQAQCSHEAMVTGAQGTLLAVMFGNGKFRMYDIPRDPDYVEDLMQAEVKFWEAVQEGRMPYPTPVKPMTVKPKPALRKGDRDMTGNNQFADAADDYVATKEYAKRHEEAKKRLKEMMPADAERAVGYGIQLKTNKSGSVLISEVTEEDAPSTDAAA